jgi:hypothetical protein
VLRTNSFYFLGNHRINSNFMFFVMSPNIFRRKTYINAVNYHYMPKSAQPLREFIITRACRLLLF